jgi:hypothetical protein
MFGYFIAIYGVYHRLLSWILVKNAGDPSLVGMKDKNGYTASDHAGMGKTSRL